MAARSSNMSENPQRIIVVGANGGIGSRLLEALLQRYPSAAFEASYHRQRGEIDDPRVRWRRIDVRDEDTIAGWAAEIERVDWLLNCVGFLHGDAGWPEKSIHVLQADFLLENVRVNTLPTLLLAKHFDAAFKAGPAPLLATISARVGSIEDNRLGGWYSYRISKAALNMALKTLSIEWRHRHPRGCVAALHPGTNDTALSKPYQLRVTPENLFDPADTADSLLSLLAGLEPSASGNFWAWDGERIPW